MKHEEMREQENMRPKHKYHRDEIRQVQAIQEWQDLEGTTGEPMDVKDEVATLVKDLYNIFCSECAEPFCTHWQQRATQAITALLTTVRKDAREVAFKDATSAINAVPMSRYWSDSGEEIARSFRAQAIRRIEAASTEEGGGDG